MTQEMRSNSSVIDIARDIMSVISPTTGVRGSGKVLIKTKETTSVNLPRNWHLIPIVNGAAREDLLFKVGQGPLRAKYPNGKRIKTDPNEPDTESWWSVQPGGTLVNIHSLVGGNRHNLPKGTKFIFDPGHPDLESEAILQRDITDGADPTHFGGCRSVVQFEQLNAVDVSLDTFRASVGKFPAVVIVWDGSEPADGTTQSSIDRGRTRVGPTMQLFKERFNLFVIVERLDSGSVRSAEGLLLLDHITGWLTDQQSIDGQIFSSPTGVQIRGRGRVAGNNTNFQHVYVYLLQISVTTTLVPYDSRTFSLWLRTHNEFLTFEKDGAGERKVVVSQDIDMTAGSE
jgi:hypothetical protein